TTPGTHETAPLRKKRKVSPGNESEAWSVRNHAAYITLAVVPRIAGKTLTAWTEFFAFWDQFEREQSVVYRTRDCQTAKLYNITRTNHPKRQVPASFGYAFRKYVCTLGRKQKSRSTGKRAKRKERYRAYREERERIRREEAAAQELRRQQDLAESRARHEERMTLQRDEARERHEQFSMLTTTLQKAKENAD
ncbi:hypothetical protein JG688_00014487, partial [Phytophthora aleatoria]